MFKRPAVEKMAPGFFYGFIIPDQSNKKLFIGYKLV